MSDGNALSAIELHPLSDDDLRRLALNVIFASDKALTVEEVGEVVSGLAEVETRLRLEREILRAVVDGALLCDRDQRLRVPSAYEVIELRLILSGEPTEATTETDPDLPELEVEGVEDEGPADDGLSAPDAPPEPTVEAELTETEPTEEQDLPGRFVATPEQWREARTRYENEGMTLKEVAALLGCTAGTVSKRRDAEGWESRTERERREQGQACEFPGCRGRPCAYSTARRLCLDHYREWKVARENEKPFCPRCGATATADPCAKCGMALPEQMRERLHGAA